jgi:dihydroflavonol-4-reductase
MRVMVTGGTGFVGAHSVQALLGAGHDVRLLVRDPRRIDATLGRLGVGAVDHVVGDVTDRASVRRAMEGCEAALHSAGVVALDRRRADEVLSSNRRGTEVVIDAALEQGLDPIVHVSSVTALFTPGVDLIHLDSPLAGVASAYGRSKAEAERYARARQDEGAPITITYPGGVSGPAAGAAMGEIAESLLIYLRTGVFPLRHGAWSILDARDLAAIHTAAMAPGRGPRRYLCGGHFLTMPEQAAVLRELTGRPFPVLPVPGVVFRGTGRVVDALMRVLPIESVFTAEAMTIVTRWVPTDDRLVHEELGVSLRPVRETMADALRSLHAAGMATASQLGSLAVAAP